MQPLEGAVCDLIALVFDLFDRRHLALDFGKVFKEFGEQLRAAHGGVGLGLEVVEELVRPRHELFEHAALYMPNVTDV